MQLRQFCFVSEHVKACTSGRLRRPLGTSHARRGFLTSASQSITASETLPYARKKLYPVIADITAYPSFLPFCTTAKILEWSEPDGTQRQWPSKAILGVGWGSIHEQYVSRVYCLPERIVEALAGDAETKIPLSELTRIYGNARGPERLGTRKAEPDGSLFKSLRSTWTLHDTDGQSAQPTTKVDLKIDFEFQNPLYAAMAGAAIPQVAQKVLDAFKKRAQSVISEQNAYNEPRQ